LTAALRDFEDRLASTPWMSFFLSYDPIPTARSIDDVPVLILQGETDRQVTPDQAAMLAEAFRAAENPDVTVRVFPGVNHLMLADPDGNPARYSGLSDGSVAPELIGELVDWVVDRFL
jgi:uncharacterized protein